MKQHGSEKPNKAAILGGSEVEGVPATGLDNNFGFSKHFGSKYKLGEEVGRGHFGYTCSAKFKKGELKGQQVTVKVIPKAKNKKYGKFERYGLENTMELHQMFDRIVVTSEIAWTPTVGPIPPEQHNVGFEDGVDLEEGTGDSDEVNVMPTPTGGSSEKRKTNTIGSSLTGKGKKVKLGGATYMQRQLNRLCDAVESYTTTTLSESSKKNYEAHADSTEEYMGMLLTLPGVEDARVGKGQDKV
ncbi:hypothetical protein SLEP1_g17465 [Rubroshorea leprosula]|uniref:Uncharacterized protein n=1 Tax=Rubroshorea leprosula TaxID=152421 RepID=A0AAV5IY38_9ROSI|nr:hypothetical protein SLEP1_g17465 [Rubroshorea leprosula]